MLPPNAVTTNNIRPCAPAVSWHQQQHGLQAISLLKAPLNARATCHAHYTVYSNKYTEPLCPAHDYRPGQLFAMEAREVHFTRPRRFAGKLSLAFADRAMYGASITVESQAR